MMHVLKNNILVEEVVEENKTESGLVIASSTPDYSNPTKVITTVLSCGPDVKGVKEGDTIIYLKRSGTLFKKDDKNYKVLTDDDVLVVL